MQNLDLFCLLNLYDGRGNLVRTCGSADLEAEGGRLRFALSLRCITGVREAALVSVAGAAQPFRLELFSLVQARALEGFSWEGELGPGLLGPLRPATVLEGLRSGSAVIRIETRDGPVRGIVQQRAGTGSSAPAGQFQRRQSSS